MKLASVRKAAYAAWNRAGLCRSVSRPQAWYRYGAEVIETSAGIEISGHAVADTETLIAPLRALGWTIDDSTGLVLITATEAPVVARMAA